MDTSIALTQKLCKRIGNVAVIRDVDLTLSEGTTTLLLGEAESGKSVLLKLLAGLLPPTDGKVEIVGTTPTDPASRAVTAYHAATPSLPGHLTVPELVHLYAGLFTDFDPEKATALLSELRVKTDKQIKRFSKSTRVKISLILTMCRRARLYLLDDPITGDDATKAYLLHLIFDNKPQDAAVLIAAKDITTLRPYADLIYSLEEGKLSPIANENGGAPTC